MYGEYRSIKILKITFIFKSPTQLFGYTYKPVPEVSKSYKIYYYSLVRGWNVVRIDAKYKQRLLFGTGKENTMFSCAPRKELYNLVIITTIWFTEGANSAKTKTHKRRNYCCCTFVSKGCTVVPRTPRREYTQYLQGNQPVLHLSCMLQNTKDEIQTSARRPNAQANINNYYDEYGVGENYCGAIAASVLDIGATGLLVFIVIVVTEGH